MPTGLVRYQQTGNYHFLTFSCYHRKPLLQSPAAKDTLLDILGQTQADYSLQIAAYVLMPEHVHLLTAEPPTGTLATFLQVLKQRSSRHLKSPDSKQFWQTRYYDLDVSTDDKYLEKIHYIHTNPVRRGLVISPEHYRWSSADHHTTGAPTPIQLTLPRQIP